MANSADPDQEKPTDLDLQFAKGLAGQRLKINLVMLKSVEVIVLRCFFSTKNY